MPGSARQVLLATVAITAVVYVVPGGDMIARPLVWLATLVHELGHAAMTVVVGGQVVSVLVFADGSGVTTSARPPGRLITALVAAGGLIGPAFAAALVFAGARSAPRARIIAGVLGGALLLTVPFALRGLVALSLGVVLGVGLVALAVRAPAARTQLAVVFLAVQLALSVFSRGDYLFARSAQTGAGAHASDSAQIAAALIGPYWLWGLLCGLVSVLVVVAGVRTFLRSGTTPQGSD